MNEDTADKLGEKLLSSLQENMKLFESLSDETRFQAKTALHSQLQKMNLVTREEFDATLNSLDRALERIGQLEAQLKTAQSTSNESE